MKCARTFVPELLLLVLLVARSALGVGALYAESSPGRPPEYCTLFHQMPKSGSTTIRDKLHVAAVEDGTEPPPLCMTGLGQEQSCVDAINSLSPVVTGYTELIRSPMESVGRQCEFFTMIRHPIDRLISAFFYCPAHDVQMRPRKWCGFAEHEIPVTERLLDFARQYWGNKAFKMMTFGFFCPPYAFCDPAKPGAPRTVDEPGGWELLQQVQGALQTYTAVGVLEHWDLSMELFNARVRSPVRDWRGVRKSNPGEESDLRDEVSNWAHKNPEIHAVLATDLLLYSYALSIFKGQTAESLGTVWE